jgi:YHS domain-containing protein
MILRLVVWVLAVLGFMWFWRRLQAAALQQRSGRAQSKVPGQQVPGHMVRDRICQTFLPEADAFKVEDGGKTHFFCSTACRDLFLQGQARP